jgi:predicted 3-demethylubiquinone-9 3-methyltransferase (glyoxalase superfamily)
MSKITPCLWFDTEGEEAATFYTTVFKNSRIVSVARYGEAGPREAGSVMIVEFELDGQPFTALNGGPEFKFNEAVSFQIPCDSQADVDYYWDVLTEGGEESVCGWLKDKFGVSWQVVASEIIELISDPEAGKAQRAMAAMMAQHKPDIDEVRKAAAQA